MQKSIERREKERKPNAYKDKIPRVRIRIARARAMNKRAFRKSTLESERKCIKNNSEEEQRKESREKRVNQNTCAQGQEREREQ